MAERRPGQRTCRDGPGPPNSSYTIFEGTSEIQVTRARCQRREPHQALATRCPSLWKSEPASSANIPPTDFRPQASAGAVIGQPTYRQPSSAFCSGDPATLSGWRHGFGPEGTASPGPCLDPQRLPKHESSATRPAWDPPIIILYVTCWSSTMPINSASGSSESNASASGFPLR